MGLKSLFKRLSPSNASKEGDRQDSFQTAINQIPVATFIMDKDGNILFKNRKCENYNQDFSHIENLKSAFPLAESSRFDQYANHCFETKNTKANFKTKENNKIIQFQTRKTDDDTGQVMVTFQIIDRTHTLKNWTGAIDDRFTTEMFEQTSDAALVTNRDGQIIAYNETLKALCPEPLELNAHFGDCLTQESKVDLDNALHKDPHVSALADPISIQFNGCDKSDLAGFLKPLKNGAVLVHFLKASDQKSLQLQLLQSQKLHAMGELAGGIAHDFNNLLTAMIGFCDLLLMRHSPGDQSFTDIMQIKQNANRAANLVRQLLAFSRQQTLQPRKIDVTDNLAELKVLLQRLIGTTNELKIIHGRELGVIRVDQGQLEQVIINLVVNARDALPEGGLISIKTSSLDLTRPLQHRSCVVPRGSYVVIEVTDTGIGISSENLNRIFDPFFSTKEIGTGTGLGLSTVYGILTQMEGFIVVDTELNKGTTFKIYLPRYELDKDEEPHQAPDEVQIKDLTGNAVVLLVEDEVAVRKFSARTLQEKGYEVIEAQNGREAFEYLKSATSKGDVIDLLVTDVVMPEMDGPELVERAQEILPNLKVIFMSGYAESTFRHRLSKDVDIHFLPKPFNLKDLALKVKEITGGKSQKDEDDPSKHVITNYRSA